MASFLVLSMVQSGTPGTYRGSSLGPTSEPANSTSTEGSSGLYLGWKGEAPSFVLVWGLAIFAGFQGGIITTSMTCLQTIIDLDNDQHLWLEIYEKGSDPNPSVWRTFLLCYHSFVIHVADPLFHWLFGLAVNVSADKGLRVQPIQVFYISIVAVVGAVYMTWYLRARPKTLLPATYGHLETIANLVDEWDERMYWGDKSGLHGGHPEIGHAGTSVFKGDLGEVDKRLSIKLRKLYGKHDCGKY
ncbi:hypothetical protein D9758_005812 [Tetrapyrgos nigripes]|uniref:Uncharacterized protein n=1 Tax=Tetrapyrgos nigripes TaxID=182062 RepID=A0A8H5LQX5_9AGAR|nr:hypothetical protein D9758_005812 [Tetrapyrgos nigripes]